MAGVAIVKCWPQRFSEGIRWKNDTRDMTEDDIAVGGLPLLDSKVLDIDVTRMRYCSGNWH